MGRAALAAVAGFTAVYHGRAEEVSRARREVGLYVRGCPRADDATLIISELSTNAVLHSRSRGGFFTVRCELYPDYVWLETQDAGGPFRPRRQDGDAFHGLHIIGALAGRATTGSRSPATRTARTPGKTNSSLVTPRTA
jgi:anti-sigma regulatory factor (Ser/Thr protein kinase)